MVDNQFSPKPGNDDTSETSPIEPPTQAEPIVPAPTEPKPIDDDPKTDALVEEIQHANSDAELNAAFVPETPVAKRSFKRKYIDNRKWTIPLTLIFVLLVAAFVVPSTRYKLLGLVIKKPYTITVTDSTTGTPVSKASVKIGATTLLTDVNGQAVFKKLAVGKKQASISKQYYKTTSVTAFVGLRSGRNNQKLLLQATGRQVPIKIVNKITGEPVVGAEISALQTNAKTDKTGNAVLVVPATNKTTNVTLTADGYNKSTAVMQVTSDVVTANTFAIVPSGRAYFLSNASGTVDVISANYDGTDRQTLLAGTGFESSGQTQLIPSPDQKNLALIAKRSATTNAVGLYNIATATGKLTKIEGDAQQGITAVGWTNSTFVYTIQNYTLSAWQPNQEELRSYSATSGQATTLDQTDASGTGYADELYQQMSQPALVDDTVVYAKSWEAGQLSAAQLASKTNTIFSVQPGGLNKKSLKDLTVPAGANYSYVSQSSGGPHTEYFASPTTNSNDYSQGALFFKYTSGSLTQLTNFTADNFNNPDTKGYLATSPSGSKLLYADVVDGQTVASVSDQSGTKQKLVSLHGAASVQGWLTDDYILVAQDNSQLYVISANPAATNAQPLSLASFYTAPQGGR